MKSHDRLMIPNSGVDGKLAEKIGDPIRKRSLVAPVPRELILVVVGTKEGRLLS